MAHRRASRTFIALVVIGIIVRLVQVQIVQGEMYRAAAQANQVRLIRVAAPRGMIFDRNGKVMVRSRPSFVVGLIPSEVTDVNGELHTLARTLERQRSDAVEETAAPSRRELRQFRSKSRSTNRTGRSFSTKGCRSPRSRGSQKF